MCFPHELGQADYLIHDIRHLLEIYRNLEIQAAADASPQGSK